MYVYSIKKFANSGQQNPNWQGVGDMPRSMWSQILKNAATRNIPVLMTIEVKIDLIFAIHLYIKPLSGLHGFVISADAISAWSAE